MDYQSTIVQFFTVNDTACTLTQGTFQVINVSYNSAITACAERMHFLSTSIWILWINTMCLSNGGIVPVTSSVKDAARAIA